MTDKIFEGVINEGKNRIDGKEYPFWNSFIISWLIINWKIIYITASLNSVNINDKIEQIVKLYPAGNFSDFTHPLISLVIYPILASFFAVAVIPFINHIYLWFRKFHRNRDVNLEIEKTNKEIQIIEAKKDLQEKEKELEKSEQEIWNEEYKEIEDSQVIPKLAQLIFGWSGNRYDYKGTDRLNVYDLANMVKYGLIHEKQEGIYDLSEKGIYIIKKFPSKKLKEYLDPEPF